MSSSKKVKRIRDVQDFCSTFFGFFTHGYEQTVSDINEFNRDKFLSRMYEEANDNDEALPILLMQYFSGDMFRQVVGIAEIQLMHIYKEAPDRGGVSEMNNHILNSIRMYLELRAME